MPCLTAWEAPGCLAGASAVDQAAGGLSAAGDRERSHGSEEKSSCSLATLYHNPPIALPILVLL